MNIPTKYANVLFLVTATILLTLLGIILTPNNTYAIDNLWSSGQPTVRYTDTVNDNDWMNYCSSRFNSDKYEIPIILQDNSVSAKSGCIVGIKENVMLLTSGANNLVVKFPNESSSYTLTGVECISSCVYLSKSDTYMSIDWGNTIGAGKVKVYKNFLHKLKKKSFYPSGNFYYEYPESTPDAYIGYQSALIKYIQRSQNDRWLVLGFIDVGLFRINLDTYEMIKFSDWKPKASSDIEFDISDDGSTIAVTGLNTINSIFDISNDCGRIEQRSYAESDLIQPLIKPCPSKELLSIKDQYFPYASDLRQLELNKNSQTVSFYAMSYNNTAPARFVILDRQGSTSSNLDYLALGDSYSSGEGDTETVVNGKKYYRDKTDENGSDISPREKCHISTRSYPYILSNGMNLGGPLNSALSRWQSIACSGSTMWDVKSQAHQEYEGQGRRLEGFNQSQLKTQALDEFIPGRQKQIEFVRQYKPKAITLTMGGNDIGFGEKMRSCALSINTCDVATEDGAKRLAKQIQDQFGNLKSLYEELFNASGRMSKIYVVGYPQFINGEKTTTCSDLNIGMINADERAVISKSITYLNNVIEQAAKAAGVKYLDVEDSLDGHKLCDSGKKYVTGIAFRSPSELQESFHPNAKGHYEMAMAIWGRVNNQSLIDYKWCETSDRNCPRENMTAENISSVDGLPLANSNKKTIYTNFTTGSVKRTEKLHIILPRYSMAPNSKVGVSIRESGSNLGEHTVTDDGKLDVKVTLPGDISPGPTTVVIGGETYTNEPVENEQIVDVVGPDTNDKDEDGVIDATDDCLFIVPIGKDEDKDGIDDACDLEIGETPPVVSPSPTPSSSPSPAPTPTPSVSPSPSPSPEPGTTNPEVITIVTALKKIIKLFVKVVIKIVLCFKW